MNRREFLELCTTTASIGLTGCLGLGTQWESTSDTTSSIESGPSIGVNLVAEGLTEPVQIEFPPGEDFNYIADKYGKIFLNNEEGIQEEPFLDISDKLVEMTNWEQGLVGLVLHPQFDENHRFYVRYSAPPKEEYPPNFSHTFRLSEFQAEDDLQSALPESERVILEIPQRIDYHQAGGIVFGPDDYLYIAVGDDGRNYIPDADYNQDWYWINKGGNGQNINDNLKGSILRIDINNTEDGKEYSIPGDNPLVNREGRDEYYAWGFRNPFRMSFDQDQLYVGDVGREDFEEINLVTKGGNYGWSVKEGPSCINGNAALRGNLDVVLPFGSFMRDPPFNRLLSLVQHFRLRELPSCPTVTPNGDPLVEPVVVYPAHGRHEEWATTSVICGYMYRNSTVEQLQDKFIFGELMGGGTGRIFVSEREQEKPWSIERVTISGMENGKLNEFILSFGRDREGEIYILTTQFSERSGNVYKITPS